MPEAAAVCLNIARPTQLYFSSLMLQVRNCGASEDAVAGLYLQRHEARMRRLDTLFFLSGLVLSQARGDDMQSL